MEKIINDIRKSNEIVIDCQDMLWSTLRNLILLRDKRICQDCGERSERVHVHHIDFDDTNRLPANLITLCLRCHEARHMKKGGAKQILLIKKLLITEKITINSDLASLIGLTQASVSGFINRMPASFKKLDVLKKGINKLLNSNYTIEELFTMVDY